jgi:hypothetical protein
MSAKLAPAQAAHSGIASGITAPHGIWLIIDSNLLPQHIGRACESILPKVRSDRCNIMPSVIGLGRCKQPPQNRLNSKYFEKLSRHQPYSHLLWRGRRQDAAHVFSPEAGLLMEAATAVNPGDLRKILPANRTSRITRSRNPHPHMSHLGFPAYFWVCSQAFLFDKSSNQC